MEIFKPIKNYEGLYEVSNSGRVKSLAKTWICGNGTIREMPDIILKATKASHGYRYVKFGNITFKVSCLVWDAFGNKPRNGRKLQVDHKNENKSDDRIDNLQLLTNRQNVSKSNLKRKKSSKYIGVSINKAYKKWTSYIKVNGKREFLGNFDSEIQAHLVYQKRLLQVEGC